jgi:hypothetical protein
MELLEGRTLRQEINGKPLGIEAVLDFAYWRQPQRSKVLNFQPMVRFYGIVLGQNGQRGDWVSDSAPLEL